MEDDDDLERLTTWLAGLRADHDRLARQREHWLRQQLAEETSLFDALADLVGQGRESTSPAAVIRTRARVVSGVVLAVGHDVVVVAEGSARRPTAVTVRSIEVVQHAGSGGGPRPPEGGGRRSPSDVSLEHVLLDAISERTPTRITLTSGTAVAGTVAAIGTDVITLLDEAKPPQRLTVPIRAINDLRL